uniref:Uncharacterized protein n=1 Tax=Oryza brachyantha TaxID=4533 RepID=J3L2T8_ORYBR
KKRRRTEKGSAIADGEQKQAPAGTKTQPSRRKGKAHGGVPVTVFHLYAGMRQLSLVLWESSNGTIIKGNGYMDFINRTGLKEHDTVHIWAIKRRGFRLFGATVPESPFYVVIVGGSRRTFEAPPPLCMLPP